MTHLGAEVAAYIDGQLSPEHEADVRHHLLACERCRVVVDEQRQVKLRVSRTRDTDEQLPPHLVTALAAVAESMDAAASADPPQPGRVGGLLAAVLTSSAAVLLLAYVMAPPVPREGDPVHPDVEGHVSAFLAEMTAQRLERADATVGSSTTVATGSAEIADATARPHSLHSAHVSDRLSERELDDLTASGWPCHRELSGGFIRVGGRHVAGGSAIAVQYAGAHVQLHLIEQAGSLSEGSLEQFTATTLADQAVWVREGLPTVVTWAADGVVFTVITDASLDGVAPVLEDLPTTSARTLTNRLEDGLRHMSDLISLPGR